MTPPESNFLLQLLLSAVFIGNLIAIWIGIANARRMQKREITFAETPASKREFDAHVVATQKGFDAVRAEMALDRQQNQIHSSERSKTLFNKLETTRQELDNKIEDTRRELSNKIDAMPERVIATLKNTGAI